MEAEARHQSEWRRLRVDYSFGCSGAPERDNAALHARRRDGGACASRRRKHIWLDRPQPIALQVLDLEGNNTSLRWSELYPPARRIPVGGRTIVSGWGQDRTCQDDA